jgi:predicted RNA binding protein YcfA (HicA-like mRNA interferase family)
MSKTDKLLEKLRRGKISADDLRTLMKKLGWELDGTEGSHEQWWHPTNKAPNNRLTLTTQSKDLKKYLIKEAQKKVLGEENE